MKLSSELNYCSIIKLKPEININVAFKDISKVICEAIKRERLN